MLLRIVKNFFKSIYYFFCPCKYIGNVGYVAYYIDRRNNRRFYLIDPDCYSPICYEWIRGEINELPKD